MQYCVAVLAVNSSRIVIGVRPGNNILIQLALLTILFQTEPYHLTVRQKNIRMQQSCHAVLAIYKLPRDTIMFNIETNKIATLIQHNGVINHISRMSQMMIHLFLDRWPFRHRLPISTSRLDMLTKENEVDVWHKYAIRQRHWRRHVCIACGWIVDYLPEDISIFEPGCGSGANLLWLAKRGFTDVSGTDIDTHALQFCSSLQKEMKLDFPVWLDDGIKPCKVTRQYDVILSTNWLYHIDGTSLDHFLGTYIPHLSKFGFIICDLIDNAYNFQKNNMYHSKDWKKPVTERRPSEYTFRMSRHEVVAAAEKYGLRLIRCAKTYNVPQRSVYMLSR